MSLKKFIRITRRQFQNNKKHMRFVYISEISRNSDEHNIDKYIAEKVPFFYREAKRISDSFQDEFFLRAIYDSLCRLPDSSSFQESHFGEIISGLFAEDVIGLKKIYSKLSLLTAENANAYKMDLVLYNPKSDPVELFFCEVKCSMKSSPDLNPVKHDESIYPDMFNSMNAYEKEDFDFDFAAAKDHIDKLPLDEQQKLKDAFLPYSDKKIIKFLGFAVIDSSTYNSEEVSVLATRKNKKEFDIDVICLDELPHIVQSVYSKLVTLRDQCTP
ncbi:MAG: Hachiman antiphage defense system protein HamA [Methanoregula sp.]